MFWRVLLLLSCGQQVWEDGGIHSSKTLVMCKTTRYSSGNISLVVTEGRCYMAENGNILCEGIIV
jgi:hypothetical protein